MGSYWFGSASPQPIIKKLENSPITPADLENGLTVNESDIMDYRIDDPDPIREYEFFSVKTDLS